MHSTNLGMGSPWRLSKIFQSVHGNFFLGGGGVG